MKRERELAELKRRNAALNRPESKVYTIVLFIVLVAIMMIDEFASNAPSSVTTATIEEFFVLGRGMSFEDGTAALSVLTSITIPISALALLLNTFSDKIGRKPLLIISAAGMAVGMLILYASKDLTAYMVGRIVITFFIAQDMHGMYIMEIAPERKRATYTTVAGAFGLIGIMLISVARIANTENNVLNWRGVFLVPAVVGILSIVIFTLLARETKPFLKARIEYLERSPEERKAEKERAKEDKSANVENSGLIAAFKYIFTHKTPMFAVISAIPHALAMLSCAALGEVVMSSNGMSVEDVNMALLVYPVVGALLAASVGFVADKLGRKPSVLIYGVLVIGALVMFVVSASLGWSPILVGIFYGIELRGYWSLSGVIGLTFKESVPTRIRAASVSAYGLVNMVFNVIGPLALSSLLPIIGITSTVVYIGVAALAICIAIYMLFCKETKDVRLEEIQ